jgi:hypothetical protein
MAGGGIKAGTVYGSTDDYGYYAGRDFRLTDVAGKVVQGIVA